MLRPRLASISLPAPARLLSSLVPGLVLCLALGPYGCGGDDETASDTGALPDAGATIDTGVDAGVDAGSPEDAGTPDTGTVRPDAGYYCTMDGTERVEGEPVPVPEATETPATAGIGQVSVRCIDREVEPFDRRVPVCFTQCLDFLGYEPTPEEVQELEVDVFEVDLPGGGQVDPTYDYRTREERSPDRRLGIGAVARPTATSQCDSGYQLELGFLDLGAEMSSEVAYVIRVRSRAVASPTWVTLYLWDFIRRLDEANQVGGVCSSDESRIPERGVTFPVVSADGLRSALSTTTASVAGADDLFDGRGQGYALVETRDCSTPGALVENLTVGFAPAPAGFAYADPTGAPDPSAEDTSARGLAFGLGFGAGTASVASTSVRTAVGINRDGACTEAFGGTVLPVFPDAITVIRTNRETTIQPVF